MKKQGILSKLDFNAPVILGFTGIAFVILLLGMVTGGRLNTYLAVRYTSWADPKMYARLFTHIFSHQNMAHYTGNFLLILAVGPLVEEKYGSGNLAFMIGVTALVTGLVNVVFFQSVALLGASAVVFLLILLASFANIRGGNRIPVTFVFVGVLYIGGEVYSGLAGFDNISQLSHILGGICGAAFGFAFHRRQGRH